MGIQINGQTDRISAVDGSFGIQDLAELNISGIVTAASANFTGNVSIGGTLTYQDVTNIDSVGVVTARAGVHVTGGNVAVGHNNPSVNLHVKGSASNGQIYLGGTGAHSQIYADNDGVLILNADQGNSAANSYLGFNVDNSERLRITSAGLVGVNCTPLSQFQVKSGTNQNIALSSMSSEASIEAFNDAGSANVPLRLRASAHKFFIGSTEGLRVHTNGLIGVGHDSPTAYGRMTVAMPSQSGGAAIQVANSSIGSGDGTTSNIILRSVNNIGNNWAGAEYRASDHIFAIQGTEKLRINSDGRLLINATNNPTIGGQTPYLRVNGGYANLDGLRVRGLDTGNTIWKDGGDMSITVASAHSIYLKTQSATGLQVTANGQVATPLQPGIYLDALDWSSSNNYMHNGFQFWQVGSHWNNSTGTFTCPVAGKYFVAADAQVHNTWSQSGASQQYSNIIPRKNNSNYGLESVGTSREDGTGNGGTATHNVVSFSIIMDCAANDTIRVYSNHGFRSNTQNHLTIYLLG